MTPETEYEERPDYDEYVEHESSSEYEAIRETVDRNGRNTPEEPGNERDDTDPSLRALAESKGGNPEDWERVGGGSGQFVCDGEKIYNPVTGELYADGSDPEALAVQQEFIRQYNEGGSRFFQLPDYLERTADGETLYVTQLIMEKDGGVSWAVYKFETKYPNDDGVEGRFDDALETHSQKQVEVAEEIESPEIGHAIEQSLPLRAHNEHYEGTEGIETLDHGAEIDRYTQDEVPRQTVVERAMPTPDSDTRAQTETSNDETTRDGIAPDAWLVELLSPDSLRSVDTTDRSDEARDAPTPAGIVQDRTHDRVEEPTPATNAAQTERMGAAMGRITTEARAGQTPLRHEPEPSKIEESIVRARASTAHTIEQTSRTEYREGAGTTDAAVRTTISETRPATPDIFTNLHEHRADQKAGSEYRMPATHERAYAAIRHDPTERPRAATETVHEERGHPAPEHVPMIHAHERQQKTTEAERIIRRQFGASGPVRLFERGRAGEGVMRRVHGATTHHTDTKSATAREGTRTLKLHGISMRQAA